MAFSSMALPVHEIVNTRFGSKGRTTPDGKTLSEKLAHFGFRIAQIAKRQRALGDLYTGRHFTFSQTLCTEFTLLHHALRPGRKIIIRFFQMRTRVHEVETPGTVRAASHAVTAADTAVKIHHDDAIFTLERSLGRANPNTRRIVAMVTQGQRGLGTGFRLVLMEIFKKKMIHVGFPDPFDILIPWDIRDIVNAVTGVHNVFHHFLVQLGCVDDHGPAGCLEGVGAGMHRVTRSKKQPFAGRCAAGSQKLRRRADTPSQYSHGGNLQEISTQSFHFFSPFGST